MTDNNQTISYTNVENRLHAILKSDVLHTENLRSLYREIEIYNAHKIIAGKEDRQMKDVEFLVQSAVFLIDMGKPGDWKLQLEAAIAMLTTAHNRGCV